jgi:hypothetical protein
MERERGRRFHRGFPIHSCDDLAVLSIMDSGIYVSDIVASRARFSRGPVRARGIADHSTLDNKLVLPILKRTTEYALTLTELLVGYLPRISGEIKDELYNTETRLREKAHVGGWTPITTCLTCRYVRRFSRSNCTACGSKSVLRIRCVHKSRLREFYKYLHLNGLWTWTLRPSTLSPWMVLRQFFNFKNNIRERHCTNVRHCPLRLELIKTSTILFTKRNSPSDVTCVKALLGIYPAALDGDESAYVPTS